MKSAINSTRGSALAAAFSALPPFPGKLRLVDSLGKLTGRLGNGHASFSPWPGARFEVDLRDRIQRQMWGGCYEPHVHRCLEALLRSGDVFLDIGAHIGYHAAYAACRVGAGGQVHAFEPNPALHALLTQNLAQFSWAQAHLCAVWETSGTLGFEGSSFAGESGWGTLTAVRDLGKGEHTTVQAVRLDDWTRKQDLSAIHAIKIDAEGAELAILRGARELLARCRPILLVEINDVLLRYADGSAAEVKKCLAESDYDLFSLSWPRVSQWSLAVNGEFSDALCVPRERAQATLAAMHHVGFRQ